MGSLLSGPVGAGGREPVRCQQAVWVAQVRVLIAGWGVGWVLTAGCRQERNRSRVSPGFALELPGESYLERRWGSGWGSGWGVSSC